MSIERRREPRYAFAALAEAVDGAEARAGHVKDLSTCGTYLAMRHPFSKGAPVRIKIGTTEEFFECQAIVVHSSPGLGMGVLFRDMSSESSAVLSRWVIQAMRTFPS